MNPQSDHADLIAKCLGGDTAAFGELMAICHPIVLSLALRFLGDREEARDVVQEAFIRAWKNLVRYDNRRSRFSTWLYRIVVNLCLDYLKTSRRQKHRYSDAAEAAAVVDDPEAVCLRAELVDRVIELSRNLPPRQQAVFVLRDLEDFELDEIAGLLRISRMAVKSNLCTARRTLRKWLPETVAAKGGTHEM